MISLVLALFLAFSLPAYAGECEGPEDCGLVETIVPDFELTDENSRSGSHGRTLTRDDLLGEVLLIYWAQAT